MNPKLKEKLISIALGAIGSAITAAVAAITNAPVEVGAGAVAAGTFAQTTINVVKGALGVA